MPGTAGPNIGFTWGWSPGDSGWGVGGFNPNWAAVDTLLHLAVLEITSTPPGSPANGDRYIVGASATGAWSGHDDEIAVWLTTGVAAWVFYPAKEGWRAWKIDTQTELRFDGSAWSGPMRAIGFGADPTALLTANQEVFYHRFAFPFTLPANMADYEGASTTLGGTANATANTVMVVQKATNAAPLTFAAAGTITIGSGSVTASAKTTAGGVDITFAKGDILRVLGPASPDATFKGVFGTIVGFQT